LFEKTLLAPDVTQRSFKLKIFHISASHETTMGIMFLKSLQKCPVTLYRPQEVSEIRVGKIFLVTGGCIELVLAQSMSWSSDIC
jgi:hypothetical protein